MIERFLQATICGKEQQSRKTTFIQGRQTRILAKDIVLVLSSFLSA